MTRQGECRLLRMMAANLEIYPIYFIGLLLYITEEISILFWGQRHEQLAVIAQN